MRRGCHRPAPRRPARPSQRPFGPSRAAAETLHAARRRTTHPGTGVTTMWAIIKSLLLKWPLFKLLLKSLGSLAWLIPVAFVLKAIGLPILILLAVLALPLIIVLVVLGLPLILIAVVGGGLLMLTFWVVSLGLMALKIALPIILVFCVIRWLMTRNSDARLPPDVIRPDDAT